VSRISQYLTLTAELKVAAELGHIAVRLEGAAQLPKWHVPYSDSEVW
jgi:hypothetical protein